MLGIKEAECVGFESQWRVKKVTTSSESQTDEILKKESETFTHDKKSIETQTDPPNINYDVKYDPTKLENFLRKVYPKLAAELDDQGSSSIFKNYCPFEEQVFGKAKILQTINVNSEENDNKAPKISAMSWNSTGSTIAVATEYEHSSWCHHNGLISLYSFDRNDVLPEIATKKIKTGSCVKTLTFHPELPYIIAAGTYSGEICLWNIQHEESEMLIEKISGHDDLITEMQWITRTDKRGDMVLVTSSIDGFIKIWKLSSKTNKLVFKTRYIVQPPLLNKFPELSTDVQLSKSPGILSFHFSLKIPEVFVVAAEGGVVVQCSILGAKELTEVNNDSAILDPCVLFYEPHNGQISTIRFSPNHKDQFLSISLDGEIRIYVLDQDFPVRTICLEVPLVGISWVPYHDKFLIGCGLHGVEIFNVVTNERLNDACEEKAEDLLKIEISLKRPTTIVTGTNIGYIQLWSIPWGSLSPNST